MGRNDHDSCGVFCARCAHFQSAGVRCGLYDCEIVTKLTLRIHCPDYQEKPLVISRVRMEYMRKYRAEHRAEINEKNREYMRKKRLAEKEAEK